MNLDEKISEIIHDYLNAFQVPYAELSELDIGEREELLDTLMDELAIAIQPEDLARLIEKPELNVSDVVESFETGEPLEFGF